MACTMENYLHKALESVTLTGAQGIEVEALFAEALPTLPKWMKEKVWKNLVSRYGDVLFHKGCRDGGALTVLAKDCPELESYESAVSAKVVLSPSSDLYDALLGVYGNSLLRFGFSNSQKAALLLLVRAGSKGMAQNELAQQVGVRNNNAHYVIKSLSERNLIFRKKANVKMETGKGMISVSTHYVFLSKYQSNDANGVKSAEDSLSGRAEASSDSGQIVATEYVNDRLIIQKIIQELENSSQNIAIEAYLKVSLGFEYVSGHRSWRRIRGIMESMGLIEVFQGITDNNKTEKFIRLLKTLDDIDKKDSDSIGPMTLFDRPLRGTGSQVFDMSLDRQIILALAKAGGDGMTSADLDALLSLNLKRNSQRLAEIYERYTNSKSGELRTDTVNSGRSILKRYTFSRALADEMLGVCHAKVSTDVPPEPPQGGWLQAVNRASAFMLSEKDIEEVLNKGSGEKVATENDTVSAEMTVPSTNLNASRGKLKTEIAKRRKEWLVEAVHEQKFILGSEAGSVILEKEKAAGFLGATSIDKKMYMRAASTAQEEKLIDILTIQVPNQSGTTGTQTQLVFIPHDTQFGDDLFQSAIERYQNNFKSKQPFKDSNKVPQENLPRVSGLIKVTSLEEKRNKSNESYQIALKNGYNQSKLHRCQILADSIWQLIDNRPPDFHDPAVSEFWKKLSEQNVFVFSRQHVPKKDNRQINMSRFDLTEQNQRFLFNVEEIWRNLTVTDFLRALGSTCANQEIIESHRGKKLGQLDTATLIDLAGGRKGYSTAQKHFSNILDMLHRMGFIKAILPHGKMHSSRLEGTLFMANPVVIHESMGDSTSNLDENNAAKSKIVKEFNVLNPSQREGYWISLQYLFYTYPKKGSEQDSVHAQTCFPLDRAPEAINDKGYASKNECVEADIEKARLYIMQNIANRQWGDMPWERVKSLSENINVPHEAVIKAVSRLRKKKATKRLDGLVTALKKKEKEVPKKKKKERMKAEIQTPAVRTIEEEEEEAELVMLHPESPEPPTRKRKWYEAEDRKLLHAWIGWLCHNGKGKMLVWKHVKNRPMSVKWHSCRHRITKLMQDSDVSEYMKVIKDECEMVYQRHTGDIKQKGVAKKMAKKISGQSLFEVRDEADLASSQKILSYVEKVVQSAPMRHSESLDVALIFESSKYRRKSLRSSWNPIDAYLWLRSSSKRSKLSGESALPGVELTAAIAMIISYLYALEFEGRSSDEIAQDLEKRFSCETLKTAFKILAQNELVSFEVTERQHVEVLLFCLTDRFKTELKPPFSPGLPWLDSRGFLGLDKSRLWSLSNIIKMEGGALPLLTVGIMGGANFHIIMPSSAGSQSMVLPDSGEAFLRQDLASVHLKNPKEVISAVRVKALDKEIVKYTPTEVLRSLKSYNEAREAFLAETQLIINVSAANSILEMITKAGPHGLPRSSLEEFLELNKISVDVANLENLLSQYGICRVMNGFNATYMLSTELSNHLVLEKATSHGSSKEDTMEVPIRPWINSNGQLLKTFWKMLISRVLDVVSRFPGADGDILCQSLRVLVAPKFCQEVIQILCKSDVLYFEHFAHQDRFTKGILSAASFTYPEQLLMENNNLQSEKDRIPFSSGSLDEYYFYLNPIKSLGALDVVPSYA